jgi:hypothetical protein
VVWDAVGASFQCKPTCPGSTEVPASQDPRARNGHLRTQRASTSHHRQSQTLHGLATASSTPCPTKPTSVLLLSLTPPCPQLSRQSITTAPRNAVVSCHQAHKTAAQIGFSPPCNALQTPLTPSFLLSTFLAPILRFFLPSFASNSFAFISI